MNFYDKASRFNYSTSQPNATPVGSPNTTAIPFRRAHRKYGPHPNDQRSAEKIASHPLFASLKNYPKIIEDFKTQVGGDWNDSKLDPDTRANIAANAERVLIYMDSLGGAHSKANNHKIDGKNNGPTLPLPEKFRGPESEVALFSEAWRLLDFSKDGYSALLRPPLPPL